jgi:hypothetical protein
VELHCFPLCGGGKTVQLLRRKKEENENEKRKAVELLHKRAPIVYNESRK